ncbi:hypothetical protein FIBSPDRAFT_864716 [Athelia psychrophila]|uniref:Uncharacterized protein n=1 Tax=Athelia psychrophila TaxID=1759441 RepID=A0A166G7C2_9AGAM|nr:hypothetical protein FIBSPDRAFT_864716 [Fibularhizoctonia sp. CBS 109695]
MTSRKLVSQAMPLVASFQVANGLVGSCGKGHQELGALFNLVAYHALALPVGIAPTFHPKNADGPSGTVDRYVPSVCTG